MKIKTISFDDELDKKLSEAGIKNFSAWVRQCAEREINARSTEAQRKAAQIFVCECGQEAPNSAWLSWRLRQCPACKRTHPLGMGLTVKEE